MKDTTNSRASPCSSSVWRALGSSFFPFFYFWRMGWVGGSYIAELFEVTEYLNAIGSNTLLPKSCFLVYKYICVRVLFFSFFKENQSQPKKVCRFIPWRVGHTKSFQFRTFFSVFNDQSIFYLFFNSFTLFLLLLSPFFCQRKTFRCIQLRDKKERNGTFWVLFSWK